jgi:hypothetical protein
LPHSGSSKQRPARRRRQPRTLPVAHHLDVELRALFAAALRLYAAKAENDMRVPLPPDGGGVTITDSMIFVTDLLHALNVQLFELSMWQAMTGNCIAPHQRVDAPQS